MSVAFMLAGIVLIATGILSLYFPKAKRVSTPNDLSINKPAPKTSPGNFSIQGVGITGNSTPGTISFVGESTAQRYIRLQKEWREANDIANNEKTAARIKADNLFREYMDAEADLKKEANQ